MEGALDNPAVLGAYAIKIAIGFGIAAVVLQIVIKNLTAKKSRKSSSKATKINVKPAQVLFSLIVIDLSSLTGALALTALYLYPISHSVYSRGVLLMFYTVSLVLWIIKHLLTDDAFTFIPAVQTISHILSIATEWIALGAVMNYCIWQFLCTTTFWFNWTESYRTFSYTFLAIMGAIQLVKGAEKDMRVTDSVRAERKVFLKLTLIIAFSVPCYLVATRFGYNFLTYIPLATLCLYNIDTDRVLKIFTACISTLLVVTVLCALSGAIKDLVYLQKYHVRGSYGIVYPTDFAAYLVYLFLLFWGTRHRRSLSRTLLAVGVALAAAYGIYTYPYSVTSTICFLLIAIAILYDALNVRVLMQHKGTKWISKVIDFVTVWSFPFLTAMMGGLVWLYGRGINLVLRLDQQLSSRISSIYTALQNYGLNPLGAQTPQNGSGGGLIHTEIYEFLDSTYGLLFIRYGWILFLIAAFLWVYMTRKSIKTGHRRLALAFALVAFHCFSEHHFPELNYNVLLAMPLCKLKPVSVPELIENKAVDTAKQSKRVLIANGVTLVCIVGTILFLLPDLLTLTRGYFLANGWIGSDLVARPALFTWLGLFGAFALICLFIRTAICHWGLNKKASTAAIASLVLTLCLSIVGSNRMGTTVEAAALDYTEELSTNATALELVLSAATEPVYAGQSESYYKGRFSGLSNRILPEEELARIRRGTVLLPHDDEGYQLISMGARYTELSPYTGLFTYDDAVVEALTDAGYRFHGFYSAERNVDIQSMADMNGLAYDPEMGLQMFGAERTLIYGPYLEQYKGTYSVNYSVKVTSGIEKSGDKTASMTENENQELFTMMITSVWGSSIRATRTIYASDLDEDGSVTFSIDYWVGDTRAVEFKGSCTDDVEIWVKSISWNRHPSMDTWVEYDKNGRIVKERYFDFEGIPLEQKNGSYGVSYSYGDKKQGWTSSIFLAADGKTPIEITDGYSETRRVLNKLSKVAEQSYYDASGKRCMYRDEYSIVRYGYDPHWNLNQERFYDTKGEPVTLSSGYAEIRREFEDNNLLSRESYYDVTGEPVECSSGYATFTREYDENNIVAHENRFYLTEQPGGYWIIQQDYIDGNLYSRTYLDANGNPIDRTDGFSMVVWEEKDEIRNIKLYNTHGEAIELAGINLAKDLNLDQDEWSNWMTPTVDIENSCFGIGTVNLGKKEDGALFTCYFEIEFKDVTVTQDHELRFFAQGAQDGKWFTGNIWNSNLINLYEAPKNGVYVCQYTNSISGDMVGVRTFDLGFRCDYWASGSFRVRNVKIETGDTSTTWSPGL